MTDTATIWEVLEAKHARGEIRWGSWDYSRERAELAEAVYDTDEMLANIDYRFAHGGLTLAEVAAAHRRCDEVFSLAAAMLCDLSLRDQEAGCCGDPWGIVIPAMYDALDIREDTTDHHLAWDAQNAVDSMHEYKRALWELMIAMKLGLLGEETI